MSYTSEVLLFYFLFFECFENDLALFILALALRSIDSVLCLSVSLLILRLQRSCIIAAKGKTAYFPDGIDLHFKVVYLLVTQHLFSISHKQNKTKTTAQKKGRERRMMSYPCIRHISQLFT